MTTETFIVEHLDADVSRLALSLAGRTDIDVPFALRQIAGYQRVRAKVPRWAAVADLHFPPRLSLEQCSGEAAAAYKVSLVAAALRAPERRLMYDLTGGMGIDFSFLAPLFAESVYVEHNEVLCALARHNFPLLGLPAARICRAEAGDFLRDAPGADFIFLDPARRSAEGRKVAALSDCSPNVEELLPELLRKARVVLLKLSPMLDVSEAVRRLSAVQGVHIFAENGECKELLLLLSAAGEGRAEPEVVCADTHFGTFRFRSSDEAAAVAGYAEAPATYLYEPTAAVMKAAPYKLLAATYGLRKLHPNTHLYTSDELRPDFPGRKFRVLRVGGFGRKELRTFVGGERQANLAVRNFPQSVAEVRKRLNVREGGREYWFATTLQGGERRLIACEKLL